LPLSFFIGMTTDSQGSDGRAGDMARLYPCDCGLMRTERRDLRIECRETPGRDEVVVIYDGNLPKYAISRRI
jgi:hypothetical protein